MTDVTSRFFDPIEINSYRHIISSRQFGKEFLFDIFKMTDYMKEHEFEVGDMLKNTIVALVFYEASTRTRLSFESAVLRLGASKIHTENAQFFSSVSKGETLEDTIRIISSYSDILILRHPDNDSALRAAAISGIPVINAGSGELHHPTQALLDIYTIFKEKGRIENLEITLIGDLLRGRTCDSLIYLMAKFPGNRFNLVSPENSKAKKELIEYMDEMGCKYTETGDMEKALKTSDVVYMTRIQKERFSSDEEYNAAKGRFILNADNVELMPKDSIILHPLPRVDEIDVSIDENPRARYFQQAKNGLYTRMALFKILKDHNLRQKK